MSTRLAVDMGGLKADCKDHVPPARGVQHDQLRVDSAGAGPLRRAPDGPHAQWLALHTWPRDLGGIMRVQACTCALLLGAAVAL